MFLEKRSEPFPLSEKNEETKVQESYFLLDLRNANQTKLLLKNMCENSQLQVA